MSNIRPAGFSDEDDSENDWNDDYFMHNGAESDEEGEVKVKEEVKDPQEDLEEQFNQAVFGHRVNNKRLGNYN